jgi:hypothetical protein
MPQLDRDLSSVTLRQLIPPDLRRRGRRLALGLVEAVELKAFVVWKLCEIAPPGSPESQGST